MKLLIAGCGYVGMEVVRQAPRNDSDHGPLEIFALTRSQDRTAELEAAGVKPVIGHWLDPSTLTDLPEVDCVLVAIPHRADANSDPEEHTHVFGLKNLVEAIPNSQPHWIYLSTTGVYGNCDGQQINEQSPVAPTRIGPSIAVAAEGWLRQQHHISSTVLRLAGIYGPGRLPLADKLRKGDALEVPQEGFLNLCHVVDIARVIWRLAQQSPLSDMYVLSDGNPVQRIEFYQKLAVLCEVSEPVFRAPSHSQSSSRGRRASNKRIDPSRIIKELEFEFRYPTYREGLAAAIDPNAS